MGVADYAFFHSVRVKKKIPPAGDVTGDVTEIILEPKGAKMVAKNHLGQELYQLKFEGDGAYSMRDNHGNAVLKTRRDPSRHNVFLILDKESREIGHSANGSFQWEGVSVTWNAKSIGLLSDAVMVAYRDSNFEAPHGGAPEVERDEELAQFKMANERTPGYLRTAAIIQTSHNGLPPLGVFLFEAMILNQGYLQANTLRRLSITSSLRR